MKPVQGKMKVFENFSSEHNEKPEEKLLEASDVEESELAPSPSGAVAPALGLAAGGVGVGTVALGTTLALGTAIGSLSYLSGQTWNPFYQNEKTEIKKVEPEEVESSRLSKISLEMTKSIDSIKAGIGKQIKKLPSASGAMVQTLKGPATSITKLIIV